MPLLSFPFMVVGGPRCSEHGIALFTPNEYKEDRTPYCLVCAPPMDVPERNLIPERHQLRLAVANSITNTYGPDIWADVEFGDMWRFYQSMVYEMVELPADFLAGLFCGVWTLRALKRETNERKALGRRVKESGAALRRALPVKQGPDLEPTVGRG